MTSENLYNLLLSYIRADKRGQSLSPDEFNRMSPMVNAEVMAYITNDPEGSQDKIDAINYLKVLNTTVAMTAGSGNLPADYNRLLGNPRYTSGSTSVNIDVITSLEYSDRLDDALTEPSATHPVAVLGGGTASTSTKKIYCYPAATFTGINIYIDYLKDASDPYLDYYVNDTTYVKTFIAAGATNTSVPTGSTYRDGTAGPTTVATSLTVNPVWEGSELNLFIYLFLIKLGITVNDFNLVQYGISNQAKIESDE